MEAPSFAQWFVAGTLAARGWVVYRPSRRGGYAFIVHPPGHYAPVLRPLEVVGVYPPPESESGGYGFTGPLPPVHPHMIFALAYFRRCIPEVPAFVLYLPPAVLEIRDGLAHCRPAELMRGRPVPTPPFEGYMDERGLTRLEGER